MTIIFNYLSIELAILDIEDKNYELPLSNQIKIESDKQHLEFSVRPKENSCFDLFGSDFVVKTNCYISTNTDDPIIINLEYQTAESGLKSKHIYKRIGVETDYLFSSKNEIIPPEPEKKTIIKDIALSIPVTILFIGLGSLAISAVAGIVFSSIKIALICFAVCILISACYEVFENVILDKVGKKLKKHSRILREIDEPCDYEICSNSDFIEYCFKKNSK